MVRIGNLCIPTSETSPKCLSFRDNSLLQGHKLNLMTLERGQTSASRHIATYLCSHWRQKILSPCTILWKASGSLQAWDGEQGYPWGFPKEQWRRTKGPEKAGCHYPQPTVWDKEVRQWSTPTFFSSHLPGFPLENETFHSICLNYAWTQLICIPKHSGPWRNK